MKVSNADFTVLILAAGRSERMGSPKPLLKWKGKTFLQHMLSNPIFHYDNIHSLVVLGHNAKDIETQLFPDIRFITNHNYDSGRTSSVQCGINAFQRKPEGFFVWPVDCPLISSTNFGTLIDHFQNPSNIIIPSYNRKRGHPPLIGAHYINDILEMEPDEPLRDLYNKYKEKIVHVVVDDPAVLHNINTPEAYQNLLEQHG